MNKQITLCKLAAAISRNHQTETDVQKDDDDDVFEYNNNTWKALDFLKTSQISFRDILDQINDSAMRKRLKVQELHQNGQTWLVVSCLSNPIDSCDNLGRFHMHVNLFLILFRNFVDVNGLSGDMHEPSKVMKKYVTTKLYDALQKKHSTMGTNHAKLHLPACFRSKLCRYQETAVNWLCDQETNPKGVPILYDKLFARDNETRVYSHKLCLQILEEAPESIQLPPGGILADEMGLGKTVEMLALILLKPRPPVEDLPNALIENRTNRTTNTVFCLCGSTKMAKARAGNIQCDKCFKWQHLKCVGKFNGDHDDSINTPYACPECWSEISKNELVPSRATFIISPNTIKLQWLSEIRKHVYPSLRVFVYDGISNRAWISPRQLAQYDVVLTDYNVLRGDVYHTSDNVSNRAKRHESKFMRLNTPILMIQWWRVCLDEAQMVESNTSLVAKMARKLPAVNRWAVTGTPIQNSVDDLQGLLEFIGFNAICEPKSIWDNLVRDFLATASETRENDGQERSSLLTDLLQLCMWRNCKSKVESELNIPPQTQEVHYIRLSNLEKLFYSEQHTECKEKFNDAFNSYMERTQKYRSVTSEISPEILKNFLNPLLKIRQCCTMPVIISGGGGKQGFSIGAAQKKFLRPKDLHEHLKNANELECKSALRSMASAYNGLAAIYFIRKEYNEAIRHYEFVLKLARDHDGLSITVDSLLQIHALHNILQAYYTSPKLSKELPSETIQRHEEQCNKLEWKYLEPYATQLKRVQEAFESEVKAFTMMTSGTITDLLQFMAELAEVIADDNEQLHIPLMAKIYAECTSIFPNSALTQASSIRSTLYVLSTWTKKVSEVRNKLIDSFKQLEFFTNNVHSRSQVNPSIWREMMKFVNKVYDCHLSEIRETCKDNKQEPPVKKKKRKSSCDLCELQDILNSFECLLFNKVLDEETNMAEGLANPSPQITVIKVIIQFAKSKTKFASLASEFDKHCALIDSMQSLWKKMVNFWIEIDYTVKAYDELDMCKMRMSLTDNEDEKSNFKLLDYEVSDIFAEQQTNLYTAQKDFAVKLARLKYILHLEANSDPGACPICHSDDEPRYAVLECGHHICLCCLEALTKFNKTHTFNCSICRHRQSSHRVYYVNRTNEQGVDEVDVKGDYSSKITYIVRQVLKLKNEAANSSPDENPKIIIFSQWEPILVAIGAALSENGIRHRKKWSPKSIEEFKNPHLGITCMLMLLSKGSKGLNLVEATHVFLVEPILNPAEELQAIGRVHRIGQTKPTVVHRFIVSNTIEENIYNTVNRGKDAGAKWEFDNMTLESLRSLLNLGNDVVYDL